MLLDSMETQKTISLSIMFVDQEAHMHNAIKRSFRKMSGQWDLRFAFSPDQALDSLSTMPADLLITAMAFTGQSGMDLLESVRRRFPQMVRMVLSGSVSGDVLLKSADVAHQYLAKPFEADELEAAITRSIFVKELLDKDDLQQVVSRIDSLPSLPSIYVELVQALKSENTSIATVGAIVAKDPGLAAKLLKLANSSYFGRPQQISDPAKAVSLLGLDLVRAIVLTAGVLDSFNRLKFENFSIETMWQHAMLTAEFSKILTNEQGLDRKIADIAFTAGLLHDIGKLLIAAHLPESFAAVVQCMRTQQIPMAAAELQILGTTHAAIGAYLLGLWGLPGPIIEIVAFHHSPDERGAAGSDSLTTVHVANALANAGQALEDGQAVIEELDYQYLEQSGALSLLRQWRRICAEHLKLGPVET